MKGQLTLRGVVIGCIGCAIITASSVYVALKMGALPWPIIFAAIISLFLLKAVSRGRSTLNEANVTHTVMSSGAMVAGGLAFTIPGAWMLGLADEVSLVQMLVIALSGSALGLVASILFRKHFVEDTHAEFPIGEAAAQTLKAGDAGGSTGKRLFGSLGFAGIYCFLRDGLKLFPSLLCSLPIPGVAFGIYNSPMMLSVGFLVGTGAVCFWFLGAVIANFGIIVGGTSLGFLSVDAASQVVSCLGMGCMMGCGIAVIAKDIIPKGIRALARSLRSSKSALEKSGLTAQSAYGRVPRELSQRRLVSMGVFLVLIASVVTFACIFLGLPVAVALIVVVGAFVACAMSAQSVGQTGIDPMEIFGLIVLLLIAAFVPIAQVKLFFIAALVAVACGLAGDVMNDFKAGHTLGTDPRAQWVGQGIGAVVGSVVAVLTMMVLFQAYGPGAFGVGQEFVSAQASVVASMVSGITNMPAFLAGLALGIILYLFGLPSMMLGLGIYLPFYMSFTAFIGAMIKVIYDAIAKYRMRALASEERARAREESNERGLIVASGLLGGESIIGIVLAMVVAGMAFVG